MILNKPGKIYKGKGKKFGRLYICTPVFIGRVCTQCDMHNPAETDYRGSHCMRDKWVECNLGDSCIGPVVLKEIKDGI